MHKCECLSTKRKIDIKLTKAYIYLQYLELYKKKTLKELKEK